MNSCLYECDIMHMRFSPKKYKLNQKIFMFYIDLDEVDELARRLRLFSHNRFNLFNFVDADHFPFKKDTVRENFEDYLSSKNVVDRPKKIRVLTHARVLGHVFNPVSLFFSFDETDRPLSLVAEVGNTFGEQKPFFLDRSKFSGDAFVDRQPKHYYISPFIPLDAELDFHVRVPAEELVVRVDDWRGGDKFFISTLTGRRVELTDTNLLRMALRYPAVTLQVITMIHWHAMRLWLLGVPHHKKEDRPDLQRGLTRERPQK